MIYSQNQTPVFRLKTRLRPLRIALSSVCIFGALAVSALAQVTISDTGQGVFNYTGTGVGLSGLTWMGGSNYRAISDETNASKAHALTINLNSATGQVTSASLGTSLALAGYDSEGIAYHPGRGTLFVSDEGQNPDGGYIREFNSTTGALVNTVSVPSVMLNDRSNFGFESMSVSAGAMWTANEEALAHESALSTASTGSLVRLQNFNATTMQPIAQWAYRTDSWGGDPFITSGSERSGVSDLLALPDGSVLVLERSLGNGGFIPSLQNKIYLVDFSSASNVSGIADLDSGGFTEVSKSLLWQQNMGSTQTHNFEGITLGPELDDGSYSVMLIADNGSGTDQQHLYALTLDGIPEPSSLLLLMVTLGAAVARRRRG